MRTNRRSHGQAQQASVEQQPGKRENQGPRLSSVRSLHPVVWKRVLDSLRQAGKAPQLVPPPLPPTPPQNQVVRQSP